MVCLARYSQPHNRTIQMHAIQVCAAELLEKFQVKNAPAGRGRAPRPRALWCAGPTAATRHCGPPPAAVAPAALHLLVHRNPALHPVAHAAAAAAAVEDYQKETRKQLQCLSRAAAGAGGVRGGGGR
eukprot:scaffold117795_cov22-Tisochrysis_lutea.AAC.1